MVQTQATVNTASKILIVYVSGSGNTQEVSEIISNELDKKKLNHDICRVGFTAFPDLSSYDLIFFGSYSIKSDGRVPFLMKEFIKETNFYKPDNIAIFGTGDTQYKFFCGAVDRLAKFYNSKYPTLKIEQSPRGFQEELIKKWTSEVIEIDKTKAL